MRTTASQRSDLREQGSSSAPLILPARAPGNVRHLPDSGEDTFSPLSSAMVLSSLVPPEDMRQILATSQRILTGVAHDLEKSAKTARAMISLYEPMQKLEQQRDRNNEALATTAKNPERTTLGDIMGTIEVANQSLSLLTSTVLSYRRCLASREIIEGLSLKSTVSSLAPILGTLERARHILQTTSRDEVSAFQHDGLGASLQILTTAYARGLPESPAWRRWWDMRSIHKTIHDLLNVYEPSDALSGLMQRTFERAYGEAGLADTIRIVDGFWSRFSIEDKTIIANFYLHAVWNSFNRELLGNTVAIPDSAVPFPLVFDAQLPEHLRIAAKEQTDGFFHFIGSRHTTGAIVIHQDLANKSSALEALNVIGHEIAHGLIYYMLQNNLTPPGCEHDMHWLRASLLVTNVEGTYEANPHEVMPRWVESLFGDFFARHSKV